MELFWVFLTAITMYLSLILLMLLAALILDRIMPSLSPSFKILAIILAADCFLFGAFSVVGLGVHFLNSSNPILTASAIQGYEIAVVGSNAVFGLFEIGSRCVTGRSLGEDMNNRLLM